MKHVRFHDVGQKSVPLQVKDGATLADVLAAAGAASNPDRGLSQNGRPAGLSDTVKDDSLVMRMPLANNG